MHKNFQNLFFCNTFILNNRKKLWSTSIFKFERKVHIWDTLLLISKNSHFGMVLTKTVVDGLKRFRFCMNVFHTMKLQNRCSYAKLHAKMLFRAMLEIMLIAMNLSKYRHFICNSKYNWDYMKQFGVILKTKKYP